MSENISSKDDLDVGEKSALEILEETTVSDEEIQEAENPSDKETKDVSKEKDVELEEEKETDIQEKEVEEEDESEEPVEKEDDTEDKAEDMLSIGDVPDDWEWEDYSKNYHRLPPSVKRMYKKMTSETGKKFEEAANLRKEFESVKKTVQDERLQRDGLETERQKRDEETKMRLELEDMTEEEKRFHILEKRLVAQEKRNQEMEEWLKQRDMRDNQARLNIDIEKVIIRDIPEEYRDKVRKRLMPELMIRWDDDGRNNRPITAIDAVAKDVLDEVRPSISEITKMVMESNDPKYVELRKALQKEGAEKVVNPKKKTKQIPSTGKSGVAPSKKETLPENLTLDDIEKLFEEDPEYQKTIKELGELALEQK